MAHEALVAKALGEIGGAVAEAGPEAVERLVDAILAANRVVCFGLGRERLMVAAFCMRLMHHGVDAHLVGDVTVPPIGPGDLAIITCGPGDVASHGSMLDVVKRTGTTTLVVTAQPGGSVPTRADIVVTIPAQTMANDMATEAVLPMGTAFEIAMLVVFDLAAIRLRERTGQTFDEVRVRHTNLE